MLNKKKELALKKMGLRGARIEDFIEQLQFDLDIKTEPFITITDFLSEDCSNTKEFEEHYIAVIAIKRAYEKTILFIEQIFEKSNHQEFRKKNFRGYRLIKVLEFLEFNISECNQYIELRENFSIDLPSDKLFIKHFDTQAEVFLHIQYLLNDFFIPHDLAALHYHDSNILFDNSINRLIEGVEEADE